VPPKGGRKHPHQDYLQVDTSNILFICAGAFVGLDKVIRRRLGHRVVGFSVGETPERDQAMTDEKSQAVLRYVQPEDFLKFGLIPEFIGRLPVVGVLHELSEEDLVHILTSTRNAITRQYQQLFAMESVELVFQDDALRALARKAVDRGTGARGLRAIIESIMLDIMFEIPSRSDVSTCVIDAGVVNGEGSP